MQERKEVESQLRAIRSERRRYSAAQVTWIREQYLCEKRSLGWIAEQIWPKSSQNSLWRIAIGQSYPDVPLSTKLEEALREAERLREIPGPAAVAAVAAVEAAQPVRAGDLLEDDWA